MNNLWENTFFDSLKWSDSHGNLRLFLFKMKVEQMQMNLKKTNQMKLSPPYHLEVKKTVFSKIFRF